MQAKFSFKISNCFYRQTDTLISRVAPNLVLIFPFWSLANTLRKVCLSSEVLNESPITMWPLGDMGKLWLTLASNIHLGWSWWFQIENSSAQSFPSIHTWLGIHANTIDLRLRERELYLNSSLRILGSNASWALSAKRHYRESDKITNLLDLPMTDKVCLSSFLSLVCSDHVDTKYKSK